MTTGATLERLASERAAETAPAVARVVAALRADPGAPLTLEEMAEIAGLSPFHLSRTFHRAVGAPPTAFQAALRLERAKALLLTTPLPVTEVCLEIGYTGLGTFTKRFADNVGLPPGRFRDAAGAFDLEAYGWLRDPDRNPFARPPDRPGVAGRVVGPEPFDGLVFVGLFPSRRALGYPVRGTVLNGPGPYTLEAAPDGRYHVLAGTLRWSDDPRRCWLPELGTLVGASAGEVEVRRGVAFGDADVALRAHRPDDAPVLVSMPLLLQTGLARWGRAAG